MSSRAACRLKALGYPRIFDYVDGIADWKAAGLATEGTANPEQRVIDAMRSDVPTSLSNLSSSACIKPTRQT